LRFRRGFDAPTEVAHAVTEFGLPVDGCCALEDTLNLVNGMSKFLGCSTLEECAVSLSAVTQGLNTVAEAAERQKETLAGNASKTAFLVSGKWTLLQQMAIREAAEAFQREYQVRGRILLRRLDVTVQAFQGSTQGANALNKPEARNALFRMWESWRARAASWPRISEWHLLVASMDSRLLVRAIGDKVSSARVASRLKSIRIGTVPGRGGVPEGYSKQRREQDVANANAQLKVMPRPRGSQRFGTISRSAPASLAAPAVEVQSSSSSNAHVPLRLGSRPQDSASKQQLGARSTNLALQHTAKAKQKKEREEGRAKPTYWTALCESRGETSDNHCD